LVKHDILSTNHNQVALCSPPDGRDADLLMGGCHKCVINEPADFHRPRPEGMSGLSLGQVQNDAGIPWLGSGNGRIGEGGVSGGGAVPLKGLAALEGGDEAFVRPSMALLSRWRVFLMLASSEAWSCWEWGPFWGGGAAVSNVIRGLLLKLARSCLTGPGLAFGSLL
jgi:hypothetical protein